MTTRALLPVLLILMLSSCHDQGIRVEEQAPGEYLAVITEGPKVRWNLGDQISVNGNNSYYACKLEDGGAWFSSETPIAASVQSGSVEAYYPFYLSDNAGTFKLALPKEQEYSPDGPGRVPMRAVSDGNRLSFRMLTGILELKLSASPSSVHISRLTIRGERALSGNFSVRQDGSASITSSVGSLSMEPDTDIGGEEKSFFFFIPSGTFSGLELLAEADNGSVVSCPLDAITVNRAESKRISITLDADAFIPSNTICYTSSDGAIITPYGVNPLSNTYENGIGTMVFSNTLTTLTSHAFDNSEGYCPDAARLTGIFLPPAIKTFGPYVFQNCVLLERFRVPANEAFTSVSANMLSGCTSITELYVPDNVTKINNNAFQNCTALRSVRLPDGITGIPQNTFNGCTALESVNIPSALSTIGVKAFMGTAVSSITIPAAVTVIPSQTFQNCSRLQEITLLRDSAGGITALGAGNVFNGCTALQHIYVPADAIEQYRSSQYWTNYSSLISAK